MDKTSTTLPTEWLITIITNTGHMKYDNISKIRTDADPEHIKSIMAGLQLMLEDIHGKDILPLNADEYHDLLTYLDTSKYEFKGSYIHGNNVTKDDVNEKTYTINVAELEKVRFNYLAKSMRSKAEGCASQHTMRTLNEIYARRDYLFEHQPILINYGAGKFELSKKAKEIIAREKGFKTEDELNSFLYYLDGTTYRENIRTDEDLIYAFVKLGSKLAGGENSHLALAIADIEDFYEIVSDNNGEESVITSPSPITYPAVVTEEY